MDVIGLSSKRSRYVTVVGTGVESGGAGTDSHAGEGGATKSGAAGAVWINHWGHVRTSAGTGKAQEYMNLKCCHGVVPTTST